MFFVKFKRQISQLQIAFQKSAQELKITLKCLRSKFLLLIHFIQTTDPQIFSHFTLKYLV